MKALKINLALTAFCIFVLLLQGTIVFGASVLSLSTMKDLWGGGDDKCCEDIENTASCPSTVGGCIPDYMACEYCPTFCPTIKNDYCDDSNDEDDKCCFKSTDPLFTDFVCHQDGNHIQDGCDEGYYKCTVVEDTVYYLECPYKQCTSMGLGCEICGE